ncbi:MAG: hypothetical protein U0Q55_20050 [Vicinamibacterales bacterium]
MITVCRTCGAALDEQLAVCPDCGAPNPWATPDPEQVLQQRGLFDALVAIFLLKEDVRLERTLLGCGALCLALSILEMLILSANTWSALPFGQHALALGAPTLGIADVSLAVYANLDDRRWRRVAVWLLVMNLVGFITMVTLDSVGAL